MGGGLTWEAVLHERWSYTRGGLSREGRTGLKMRQTVHLMTIHSPFL